MLTSQAQTGHCRMPFDAMTSSGQGEVTSIAMGALTANNHRKQEQLALGNRSGRHGHPTGQRATGNNQRLPHPGFRGKDRIRGT